MTQKTRFVTDQSRHRHLTPDANATDAGGMAGSDAHGISQRMRAVLMTALVEIINTKDLRPSEAASLFGVPQASIQLLNRGLVESFTFDALLSMAEAAGLAPSLKFSSPAWQSSARQVALVPNVTAQQAGASPTQARTRSATNATWPIHLLESRTHLTTEQAAQLLGRQCQTLRVWACYESKAPLRPVRVNGRLAWPVGDIAQLLGLL
jgi:predicted XRE-type DNA-binding protein